jgi:hypothetical protein
MPDKQRECVIWCARCREDRYEVWRVPTDGEGVYVNVTVPPSLPEQARKFCICGTQLERKA